MCARQSAGGVADGEPIRRLTLPSGDRFRHRTHCLRPWVGRISRCAGRVWLDLGALPLVVYDEHVLDDRQDVVVPRVFVGGMRNVDVQRCAVLKAH